MTGKTSEESMRLAREVWDKLSLHVSGAQGESLVKVGEILAEALERSWNQGFSDCETLYRLKKMVDKRKA